MDAGGTLLVVVIDDLSERDIASFEIQYFLQHLTQSDLESQKFEVDRLVVILDENTVFGIAVKFHIGCSLKNRLDRGEGFLENFDSLSIFDIGYGCEGLVQIKHLGSLVSFFPTRRLLQRVGSLHRSGRGDGRTRSNQGLLIARLIK